MKIIFFCSVVWMAFFAIYLEQNSVDCCLGHQCGIRVKGANEIRDFNLFKAELANYCTSHKDAFECNETVQSELNEWRPTANRDKLVKAFRIQQRKLKKDYPTAAHNALYEAISNLLDHIARRAGDFRIRKPNEIPFITKWNIVHSFYTIDHIRGKEKRPNEHIDGRLMDNENEAVEKLKIWMNQGFADLKEHAQGVCKEFTNHLTPDDDIRFELYLLWVDSNTSKKIPVGPQLAEDVYNRFAANVLAIFNFIPTKREYIKKATDFSKNGSMMINVDQKAFVKFAATKSSALRGVDKGVYEDKDPELQRLKIYILVIPAYAEQLKKNILAKAKRTSAEDEFIEREPQIKWPEIRKIKHKFEIYYQ